MLLLLPGSSLGTCSGEGCPLGGDTDQLSLRIVPGPLLEACVINGELFLPRYPPTWKLHQAWLEGQKCALGSQNVCPKLCHFGKRANLVRVWYVFYRGSYRNVLLRLCGSRGGSGRGPGTPTACRPGPSQVGHPGLLLTLPVAFISLLGASGQVPTARLGFPCHLHEQGPTGVFAVIIHSFVQASGESSDVPGTDVGTIDSYKRRSP